MTRFEASPKDKAVAFGVKVTRLALTAIPILCLTSDTSGLWIINSTCVGLIALAPSAVYELWPYWHEPL